MLLVVVICAIGCEKDDNIEGAFVEKNDVFKFVNEQSSKYIAVYGSKTVKKEAYDRAYADVKSVMDKMDDGIKKGLFNAKAKLLVVKNEDELEDNIEFFKKLLPVESVFTDEDGVDETLPSSTDVGLSNTKLELMYLCVYYSLLTESNLADAFEELKKAYIEATAANLFTLGEAYVDGYEDEIHENASEKNALKYGTYLYNLYKLYFGDGTGEAGEFTITKKSELQDQNKLGYDFMEAYFEK
jgi:hypothetical protein